MFSKVLVANRGEIAVRAFRAAYELGAQTVAVYPYEDRNAVHRIKADEAYLIGERGHPVRAYLDIDEIVRAARESGADAIYPGYGFLSENPDLARACDAAGLVFVGPGVKALDVMADKIRAKEHVAAAGVAVIPGVALTGAADQDAADRVGYPLLVKPSAGGGGKGMSVVAEPSELAAALAGSRRVAAAAFGDDTLLLERLVRTPRHIEVQLLADAFDNVIHLGERECSLQ